MSSDQDQQVEPDDQLELAELADNADVDSESKVRKAMRQTWVVVGVIAVLLFLYGLLPHQNDGIPGHVIAIFCVGITLFAAILLFLVLRNNYTDTASDGWLRLGASVAALIASLVFFSLTYRQVANSEPGEFVGMATFVDAMYFTISTTLTVGFGDIHAAGQLARMMVISQMLFTVVVLAAAGRSIGGILQSHAKRKKVERALQAKEQKAAAKRAKQARRAEAASRTEASKTEEAKPSKSPS